MNKGKDKQQDTEENQEKKVSEANSQEKEDNEEEEINIEVKTEDEEVEEDTSEDEDKKEDIDKQETGEHIKEIIEENEELNEKLKRLAAEFENYKKRTKEKERERLKYDGKNVLKKLLPVFDDIDRAVQHQEETEESGSTDQNDDNGGIKMIHKKLHNILEDLEVVKYDSEGEEFDPDRHHAIMTREDDEHDSNIVIEEIEKGYRYKDKILRYAKVIVSK